MGATYYTATPKASGAWPTERKTALASLAVYLLCAAGLGVVNTIKADTGLLTPLPDLLEVFLVPLLPTLASMLTGWSVKHQVRTYNDGRVLGAPRPTSAPDQGGTDAPGVHRGEAGRGPGGGFLRQAHPSARSRQHAGLGPALALGLRTYSAARRPLADLRARLLPKPATP